MEIFNPEEIKITNALQNKLNKISRGIEVLNQKNLSEEDRSKINEDLMIPHIRTSLGIEGIRASARQTKEVLDFFRLEDEILEGKGNNEIVNLQRANDFITSEEALDSELSPEFIKKIHSLVMQNDSKANPGSFRDVPVEIEGASHKPPLPIRIEELIQTIHEYFEATTNQDPIVLASWVHNQFTKIHPFKDGNGRTARTLQDWVLFKNRYLPSSGGSLDKLKYVDALEEADNGEWELLIEHLAQSQNDSLAIAEQTINSLEKKNTRLDFLFKRANIKRDQHNDQDYYRWREQALMLSSEFQNQCQIIDDTEGILGCKFLSNDIISKSKWELIKQDGYSTDNVFFKIWFSNNKDDFYMCSAYFGKHFPRSEDNHLKEENINTIKNSVAIYFGGYDLPAQVDYPSKAAKIKLTRGDFEIPRQDEKTSIREVILGEKDVYCYRYMTSWKKNEFLAKGIKLPEKRDHEDWIPENSTFTDIASEYLTDIFQYKGNI